MIQKHFQFNKVGFSILIYLFLLSICFETICIPNEKNHIINDETFEKLSEFKNNETLQKDNAGIWLDQDSPHEASINCLEKEKISNSVSYEDHSFIKQYLPIIKVYQNSNDELKRVCYEIFEGNSDYDDWAYRLQITLVWDDEDAVPNFIPPWDKIPSKYEPIIEGAISGILSANTVYDAFRGFRYSSRYDLESFEVYVKHNGKIGAIKFEGSWSGGQEWSVIKPVHKSNLEYCTILPNSNGAFTLYVNTWNHLMSFNDNNPSLPKNEIHPSDYEENLRVKSRLIAEYDYRYNKIPKFFIFPEVYIGGISKPLEDRYNTPEDPQYPDDSKEHELTSGEPVFSYLLGNCKFEIWYIDIEPGARELHAILNCPKSAPIAVFDSILTK